MRLVTTILILACVTACTESRETQPHVPGGPVMTDAELKQRVTVSGVSAGGYMAVQAHVALANRIGGVASVAGGPYNCASGSIGEALGACMKGEGIDVEAMHNKTLQAAATGDVAPLDAIGEARVWIFHSPADSVVDPRVSDALREYYEAYVPEDDILQINDVPAAHGWPTLEAGRACDDWGGDYINACGYDTAGELLKHLYPVLSARATSVQPAQLHEMDMSAFFPTGSGVAGSGYVYVPTRCEPSSEGCRLHIVFHGCKQGAEFVDDRFVAQSGFNEWAEANNIVVVYPQIESSMFNPSGCWDWWGYTDSDYANRNGRQIKGVDALIDAFAGSRLIGEGQ